MCVLNNSLDCFGLRSKKACVANPVAILTMSKLELFFFYLELPLPWLNSVVLLKEIRHMQTVELFHFGFVRGKKQCTFGSFRVFSAVYSVYF